VVTVPYFVGKTGLLMFTSMLAGDTQDDSITVNAVSLFAVENTVSDVSSYPRGRAASIESAAAPVLFFLGEDADYSSGQNIAVDGGRLPELSLRLGRDQRCLDIEYVRSISPESASSARITRCT
jgi:NAD(P)-dependent dehydrogenase (short-subunit alcohol dehydrogenase family)